MLEKLTSSGATVQETSPNNYRIDPHKADIVLFGVYDPDAKTVTVTADTPFYVPCSKVFGVVDPLMTAVLETPIAPPPEPAKAPGVPAETAAQRRARLLTNATSIQNSRRRLQQLDLVSLFAKMAQPPPPAAASASGAVTMSPGLLAIGALAVVGILWASRK